MKCQNCGATNPNEKMYCGECGAQLTTEENVRITTPWNGSDIAIAIGSILVIIGTFMPWATITMSYPYLTRSWTGIDSDGIFLLMGAIAILITSLVKRPTWKLSLPLGILLFLLSLYLLAVVAGATNTFFDSDNVSTSMGPGIGLCVFGMLLIVIAALGQAITSVGKPNQV